MVNIPDCKVTIKFWNKTINLYDMIESFDPNIQKEFPLSYNVQLLKSLKYIGDLAQIQLTFDGIGKKNCILNF